MKKRNTKDIFAETLLELTEQMPLNRISVTLLVKQSGLSAKTFYNHFSGIYALMTYIEENQARELQKKLLSEEYTYSDYMKDCLHLYERIKSFIRNASDNTSGTESFERKHAETSYQLTLEFLLKRNGLESVSEEIDFALRMYVFGLVIAFHDYHFGKCHMSEATFLQNCIENMPEGLRAYLR